MKLRKKQLEAIVSSVTQNFRTFGGGRTSDSNPIAIWTADQRPTFALGVDVEEVVRHIAGQLPQEKK